MTKTYRLSPITAVQLQIAAFTDENIMTRVWYMLRAVYCVSIRGIDDTEIVWLREWCVRHNIISPL